MILPYIFERPDDDWRKDAACLGADPELFFGEVGFNLEGAKAICQTCPVRQECLDFALANGEKFGLWGGLSVKERRQERRRRLRETLDERRVS